MTKSSVVKQTTHLVCLKIELLFSLFLIMNISKMIWQHQSPIFCSWTAVTSIRLCVTYSTIQKDMWWYIFVIRWWQCPARHYLHKHRNWFRSIESNDASRYLWCVYVPLIYVRDLMQISFLLIGVNLGVTYFWMYSINGHTSWEL